MMIGSIMMAHQQRQLQRAMRQERFAYLAHQYAQKGQRLIYAQDKGGRLWVWVERKTTIPEVKA